VSQTNFLSYILHLHARRSTPNERVSSNAYILRALFCEVARPRYNEHIYLQNDTSSRVCRCHDSSSEHIQEPNYSTEFPLYIYIYSHVQSHSPREPPWPSSPAFCGLDLAVNQSTSLLVSSFSPAGAIHKHLRTDRQTNKNYTEAVASFRRPCQAASYLVHRRLGRRANRQPWAVCVCVCVCVWSS